MGSARLRDQSLSAAHRALHLDEFRDALEQMPPADYLAASYYERWLFAIESLIRRKGVLDVRAR